MGLNTNILTSLEGVLLSLFICPETESDNLSVSLTLFGGNSAKRLTEEVRVDNLACSLALWSSSFRSKSRMSIEESRLGSEWEYEKKEWEGWFDEEGINNSDFLATE